MTFIRRGLVDRAVREWAEAQLLRPIGLSEIPTSQDLPYVILYPLPTSGSDGSWGDPGDEVWFMYQATCVGGDHRQTAWMSDKFFQLWTEAAAGGGAKVALPLSGGYHEVSRRCDGRGRIAPNAPRLWQTDDSYRLQVGY